jgi:hypothetical protein
MPKPADRPEPADKALLRDLRDLFRERGAERLPTAAIVAALGARHGRVRLCYALRIMCGRYRQARDPREVAEFFETVNPLPNRPPRWNIAPT